MHNNFGKRAKGQEQFIVEIKELVKEKDNNNNNNNNNDVVITSRLQTHALTIKPCTNPPSSSPSCASTLPP